MHRVSALSSRGWITIGLLIGACAMPGRRNQPVVPEEQFGHRYEGWYGGRETLAITPPDSAQSYFFYPAVVESLHVRHDAFEPTIPSDAQQVQAEVLIKGTLPDDCSALHAFTQWRAGHILYLTLQMRRPTGAVCSRIGHPFRFYAPLDGLYEPGDYIIKLNEGVYPFVVRPAEDVAS